jgi:hypothetical protein
MKLAVAPANGVDLWSEFQDVFPDGPRQQERKVLRKKEEKLLAKKAKILGMKRTEVGFLRSSEERKTKKRLASAKRQELGGVNKQLKVIQVQIADYEKGPVPQTWFVRKRHGDASLEITHEIIQRNRERRVVTRMRTHGSEDGSVIVNLEPLERDESMMFGDFCYFLHKYLEGMWKGIQVLEE